MAFFPEVNLAYVASGFAVGMLVGFTGVGGGSLMTPILILLFGVAPPAAVGTDLLYACITKSGGVIIHGLNRNVDWRIVGRLCLGSLPASIAVLLLLYFLNVHSAASNALFSRSLGAALLLTAVVLIFRRQFVALYLTHIGRLEERRVRNLTILSGAILGVLVSISSVGAGALGATVLILLYPDLSASRIAGSDIAHAVPLTLVAGLGHLALGTIDVVILISLLIGSLPGICVGGILVTRIPETIVRVTLASTLAIVAIRLIWTVG
jgi:uncharacterized membrane protein YfcA